MTTYWNQFPETCVCFISYIPLQLYFSTKTVCFEVEFKTYNRSRSLLSFLCPFFLWKRVYLIVGILFACLLCTRCREKLLIFSVVRKIIDFANIFYCFSFGKLFLKITSGSHITCHWQLFKILLSFA
jgi:hypothetical protein